MTLEIIRNVGQWRRARARKGEGRGAWSIIPSGPGQLNPSPAELSRLQSPEVILITGSK